MNRKTHRYLLCVHAKGDVDLQERKLYEVLPDERAAEDGYVRVVDDSGEDYLYPGRFFIPLELPRVAERALRAKPETATAKPKAVRTTSSVSTMKVRGTAKARSAAIR